jgi:hypothetical protein
VIEKTIADWKKHMQGELPGGLDTILADDVVFCSPIVFTPQKGKEITKAYLNAAGATFDAGGSKDEVSNDASGETGGFHYTKEVLSGHHAVLEFETHMGGKYVNGVDIITCNDEGKIIEFKVMIRPLQAINLVHAQMAAMLKKMEAI